MSQLYNEQFLPAELQAQIGALRAAGVPDSLLSSHIETILAQMEAKTTRVQLDVWKIEESLGERVERAIAKQDADLRTQLGATNQISVDILAAVREQGAALATARAEFHHGMGAIGERVTDNTLRIEAIEQKVTEHDHSRDRSIEERQLLRQDMDESKAHRVRLQSGQETMQQQLIELAEAVQRIEALLEPAGTHEAGS